MVLLISVVIVVIVNSLCCYCQTIVWDDYRDLCFYKEERLNRERNHCEKSNDIIVEKRLYRNEEPFWCISINNRGKQYTDVNITLSGSKSTRIIDYGMLVFSGIVLITDGVHSVHYNIAQTNIATFTIYPSSIYYNLQNIVSIQLDNVEMCSGPDTNRTIEIVRPNQPNSSFIKFLKKCRWIDNRIHRPPNRCELLNQIIFEELSFNGDELFYCIVVDKTQSLLPIQPNDTLTIELSTKHYLISWSRNSSRVTSEDRKTITFYIGTDMFYMSLAPSIYKTNSSLSANVLSIKLNNRESCRLRMDSSQDHITCGVRKIKHKGLITFGHDTYHGKYPWHAALYQLTNLGAQKYICGGSLISSNAILTAAHCVESASGRKTQDILRVQLGKWDISIANSDTKEFRVSEVIPHHDFDVHFLENDIAILKLENYVTYTNYIQPICISGQKNSEFYINRVGFVPGWGANEMQIQNAILHEAGMPIVTHQECRRSKREFFSSFLNENNFCSGFRNGTSVCDGDSGGGLVFELETGWHLKGIVSLGSATKAQTCNVVEYVLFTDVTRYFDWIYVHLFMLSK